jgi:ankyrin repeat protein
MHWASGPDTLLLLLESGSDPNIVDDRGQTPLHKFVERNCLKSTLYLLCHGAFPDMKGGELDETPLHIAARLCSRVLIQVSKIIKC